MIHPQDLSIRLPSGLLLTIYQLGEFRLYDETGTKFVKFDLSNVAEDVNLSLDLTVPPSGLDAKMVVDAEGVISFLQPGDFIASLPAASTLTETINKVNELITLLRAQAISQPTNIVIVCDPASFVLSTNAPLTLTLDPVEFVLSTSYVLETQSTLILRSVDPTVVIA